VEQDSSGEKWSTAYDVEYKNRRQRYHHFARDGTAFASVILPAHYSAIYAVLRHVKHRLGASWNVDMVIDWGSATGSGLWYGPPLVHQYAVYQNSVGQR
jgi:ribosomal protein RSM22 (predicted rRNA methylase)